MPRTRTKRAKGFGPQTKWFAINTSGWAIRMPAGDWNSGVKTINAHAASSRPWKAAVNAADRQGEPPFRSSLEFTDQEMSNSEDGTCQYVIVGFFWPGLDDKKYTAKHPSVKKQQPVGQKPVPEAIIERPDPCATEVPVPVVAKIVGTGPRNLNDQEMLNEESVKLFALVCPSEDGLSHPHVMAGKQCFYLPRYRDNTTDIKSRGPNWNRKILRQSARLADMPVSTKQEQYKRARNTTKVVLEHKRSLRNELTLLSEGYALSRNRWYIKELKDVLEQASKDLKHTPPVDHNYMRKFVDIQEQVWSDEDSRSLLEELRKTWPDRFHSNRSFINIEALTVIKGVISDEALYVPYHTLAECVIGCCVHLDTWKRDNAATTLSIPADILHKIVRDALYHTQMMIGVPESHGMTRPHVPTGGTPALRLLHAVQKKVKRLSTDGVKFAQDMKASAGDCTSTDTFQAIWERYAASLDTDAAKKSWMEAVRLMVSSFAQMHRDALGVVDDVAEILKDLNLEAMLGVEPDTEEDNDEGGEASSGDIGDTNGDDVDEVENDDEDDEDDEGEEDDEDDEDDADNDEDDEDDADNDDVDEVEVVVTVVIGCGNTSTCACCIG